jgi:hypothetical protein
VLWSSKALLELCGEIGDEDTSLVAGWSLWRQRDHETLNDGKMTEKVRLAFIASLLSSTLHISGRVADGFSAAGRCAVMIPLGQKIN